VRIEGSWGYYDQRRALATTLGASLSASATTLTLSATGEVEVGHTLLVDQEQLFVRELVGKTATVERGMNGTTAVAHANGAALQVYEYPLVGRAATYQAAHLFRLKDAPGGFIGSPEIGTLRIAPRLHPFVVGLLDPLRRRVVG
jgi:hypothetical protein